MERLLRGMDKSGDGVIDMEEFVTYLHDKLAARKQKAFDRIVPTLYPEYRERVKEEKKQAAELAAKSEKINNTADDLKLLTSKREEEKTTVNIFDSSKDITETEPAALKKDRGFWKCGCGDDVCTIM